jgi:hypothetical protein
MIVVNFSTKEYKRGQERLKKSLNGTQYLMLNESSPINAPSHKDSPYEFKIHAIKYAMKFDPIVLWADSSMYLVGDLGLIEKIIKEDGYFFSESGHYTARWTNDFTKKYFKLTEQESVQGEGGMTMLSAGLIGFNRESEIAMKFLEQWQESATAGCFRGSHTDHRHDQTCASIIAQRLGMKYQRGGQHMSYIGSGYSAPEENSVFHLQGLQ